jgi:hypothetical protein
VPKLSLIAVRLSDKGHLAFAHGQIGAGWDIFLPLDQRAVSTAHAKGGLGQDADSRLLQKTTPFWRYATGAGPTLTLN